MRRLVVIGLIVAIVSGVSWVGYEQFAGAKAPEAPDYEVQLITRGNIASVVSATGTVLPEREARLSFQGTGTVVRVNVAVGNRVKAGALLAQLETTDQEMAVRQAEIGLRTAQSQLAQLKEGPNAVDIAAAKAAVASAQANYQQLLKGADADQFAAANAQVEQARVALDQAQQAYDRVKDLPNVGMLPQSLQLQQATINYETAQAQYRVTTRNANQAQVAAAQAQIAQAQATLDKLERGASTSQIEAAQANVDQAQLALEQAQRRVENAKLTAPWDGVVTTMSITEGAPAQPAAPAVVLTDLSRFHIDVLVDESDIASINENQPVTVEVDALPDQELEGQVYRVAPSATAGATGVVSYLVTIAFQPTDAPLRVGMSATASIVSNSRNNVLLVPNRAVQLDRESGRAYVEKLIDGVPQRVEVRLGLRDDRQSEVSEGLSDGDRLVIRSVSSRDRLQQTFGF